MPGIEVASLFASLDLRDTASGALRSFNSQLDHSESRLSKVAGGMQSIGLGLSALTAPFVAFGATGLKVASDFENAMAQISARTGIVGADLQMISDFALQMGADTAFSAQEAADAFLQLLSSGQSASEAMATLPAVLDAAAASGEDLGATADTVTDILAMFGLGVESAADVVNALAKAAGASSADMASLGQGFGNVGPLAAQFGISVDEVAAILALFAENGIKGAEAGTQLKSMLTNMTGDTDRVAAAWARLGTSMFDATGQARPIGDVLADIKRGLDGMTEEERIRTIQDLAGSFGQLGLSALTSGASLEDMLALMDGSADAATVAAARMNTFAGRMDSLRGSIQTLQIKAMTPLMKALTPLIERATEIVNRVTDWVEANPELTSTLIQVVGAVAGLGGGLVTVGTALRLAIPAFGAIGGLIGALVSPVTLVVAGLGLLATALGVDVLGGFKAVGDQIGVFFGRLEQFGGDIGRTLRSMLLADEDGSSLFSTLLEGFGMARDQAQSIGAQIGATLVNLADAVQVNISLIPFYFEYYFGGIWEKVRPGLEAVANWFLTDGLPGIRDFIEQNVMPLVQRFFNFIGDVWEIVRPGLEQVYDWFVTSGLPAIQDFVEQHVQPMLEAFFGMIADVWDLVSPALLDLFDWFVTNGLPIIEDGIELAIGVAGDFIDLLTGIWTAVGPALNDFKNGIESVFGWVVDNVIAPIVNGIQEVIDIINRLRGVTTQTGKGHPERNYKPAGSGGEDWWYGKDQGFPKPTVPQGGWGSGAFLAAGGMGAFSSDYLPTLEQVPPGVNGRDPQWRESEAQRRWREQGQTFGGAGTPITLNLTVQGVLDLTDPRQAEEVAIVVMETINRARRGSSS